MKCYAALAFIGLHAAVVVVQTAGEMRYECVLGMTGNRFGGRREMDEDDEFEDFGETGGFGLGFGPMRIPALGSLSCPQGKRGNILLKRIKYGVSMIPRTCQSNPLCSESFDNGKSVADSCDGRSSCSVNWLQPQLLQCGRMSNYMLVEYECVDTWSSFEICETIHTVAHRSSIILTSPGYIGTSKTGAGGQQKCECIIQSVDKADIYMDYLQTQLASKDQQCLYEYVLLENKKIINQSATDKEIQICGKRHLDGQWFKGAIRITYASGDSMQKRGLLTKFTVENIGNRPMIELDCAKVNATDLQLLKRPEAPEEQQQLTIPDMYFMPFGFNGTGYLPQWPPIFSFPPPDFNAISPFAQYFAQWGINMGNQTESSSDSQSEITLPMNAVNLSSINIVATALATNMSAMQMPALDHNNGQSMTHAPNVNSVETEPAINAQAKASAVKSEAANGKDKEHILHDVDATDKGEMAAIIVACIGLVLIFGSVLIYVIHRYRKRNRLRRNGAYRSRESNFTESDYATVVEVAKCRKGGIKHAHGTTNISSFDNTVHRVDSSEKGISKWKVSKNVANKYQKKKKDKYDRISSVIRKKDAVSKGSAEHTVGKCEIAVIEVHHDMDTTKNVVVGGLHELDCLSACASVAVNNDSFGNRSSECSMVKTPCQADMITTVV